MQNLHPIVRIHLPQPHLRPTTTIHRTPRTTHPTVRHHRFPEFHGNRLVFVVVPRRGSRVGPGDFEEFLFGEFGACRVELGGHVRGFPFASGTADVFCTFGDGFTEQSFEGATTGVFVKFVRGHVARREDLPDFVVRKNVERGQDRVEISPWVKLQLDVLLGGPFFVADGSPDVLVVGEDVEVLVEAVDIVAELVGTQEFQNAKHQLGGDRREVVDDFLVLFLFVVVHVIGVNETRVLPERLSARPFKGRCCNRQRPWVLEPLSPVPASLGRRRAR